MLEREQLVRAPALGDVLRDTAVAAEAPLVVEDGLATRADGAHIALRIGALEEKIAEGLSRFENGLVLVPAAAVPDRNCAAVPAVGPEKFLRVGAAVPRGAAGHQGETAVFVLLPIPFGGELDEALESLLPPPQLLVRILRLILPGAHEALPRSGPAPLALAENVRAGCRARAQVLRRDARSGTQLSCGMPTPAGIPEQPARKRDHVGLAFGDDFLGLSRFGNQADCDGDDAGVLADAFGERDLVAGSDGNRLVLHQPAARTIDPVAAESLQFPGEHDGLLEVPAALDPVGARDAHAERLAFRPRRAHGGKDFQRKAHPVGERAAVLVVAPVRERRQEFVHQIAVSRMQLDRIA